MWLTIRHVVFESSEISLASESLPDGEAAIDSVEESMGEVFRLIGPPAVNVPATSTRRVAVGEEVFVVGYPKDPVSSRPIPPVSRVCRSTVMLAPSMENDWIELQGSFPRGFSGAPVFALSDGRLLGVLHSGCGANVDSSAGMVFQFGLAISLSE